MFVTEAGEIPGGLSFKFNAAPGLEDSLRQLIQLEAECCAWMTFSLEPGNKFLKMSITADGDAGEFAVREMFRELAPAKR